jgi:hypothetical protein
LPSRLSYFSERLELRSRWSAPGRGTCRTLVIPTRRCTPGDTRGAHPYAARGAACHAATARDRLARIVSAPVEPPRPGHGISRLYRRWRRPACAAARRTSAPRWGVRRFIHVERHRPAIRALERAALAPSPPPASVGSRPGPTFEGGPGVPVTAASPAAAAVRARRVSVLVVRLAWLIPIGGSRC